PAGRPAGKKPVQGELTGRIIHVDRFGNLVTDITAGELTALGADFSSLRVSLCGEQIQGISEYYSQAGEGALLALVGSSGRLEVAAGGRSAHNSLGRPGPDTVVTVNSGKV
ncbi:MAG: SAM hydroxide adenosyltransferase, partial [Gemmatimonadota bacterium]|nr:SAM hydroxide adenosyltransferase [Gemmatimonadota bacterium]